MPTIFGALPVILQNGTLADAAQVMSDLNKIIADGNANAAENGANSSITSLSGLTSPISQVGGSSSHFIGATSGGTAAAQTVGTLVPNNWALTTGNMLSFNPGFTSTGATTLNVGGTGALAIRRATIAGPVALVAGDLVVGQNATVVYDGTAYLLVNDPVRPLFGTLTNLASAATTDLGTIQSQNVNITGTTTITSFGSSALTTNPYFMITFAGILTLTNNAAISIPGGANVTTAAGDFALMEYLGSGNWKVAIYQKANGQALVAGATTTNVLVNIQAFTASGTYTPSANVTKAFAIVTGGGGGGGGSTATAGSGGGAGGTTLAFISAPSTLTVTIGAAGTGVSGADGTDGGATSLGTITANGGVHGTLNSGNGGNGGAASGTGTLGLAGAKGGEAGSTTSFSGHGGASFWGGGAPAIVGSLAASGNTATVLGSGGSGSCSTTNQAGGGGAAGVVVVFEFK